MVFRRDSRPSPDQIEVVIGQRASLDGRLRCDCSIRIDGTMEGGSIETLSNVLITETGRVMADITAKTVSVAGAYKGSITADRVELLEGGRLWGTINVKSFLLDEGAHFQGQLIMQGVSDPGTLGPPPPNPGSQIPTDLAPPKDQ